MGLLGVDQQGRAFGVEHGGGQERSAAGWWPAVLLVDLAHAHPMFHRQRGRNGRRVGIGCGLDQDESLGGHGIGHAVVTRLARLGKVHPQVQHRQNLPRTGAIPRMTGGASGTGVRPGMGNISRTTLTGKAQRKPRRWKNTTSRLEDVATITQP